MSKNDVAWLPTDLAMVVSHIADQAPPIPPRSPLRLLADKERAALGMPAPRSLVPDASVDDYSVALIYRMDVHAVGSVHHHWTRMEEAGWKKQEARATQHDSHPNHHHGLDLRHGRPANTFG